MHAGIHTYVYTHVDTYPSLAADSSLPQAPLVCGLRVESLVCLHDTLPAAPDLR